MVSVLRFFTDELFIFIGEIRAAAALRKARGSPHLGPPYHVADHRVQSKLLPALAHWLCFRQPICIWYQSRCLLQAYAVTATRVDLGLVTKAGCNVVVSAYRIHAQPLDVSPR